LQNTRILIMTGYTLSGIMLLAAADIRANKNLRLADVPGFSFAIDGGQPTCESSKVAESRSWAPDKKSECIRTL
jgi:hypothetical protein